jgi:hypothetical protein
MFTSSGGHAGREERRIEKATEDRLPRDCRGDKEKACEREDL